MKYSDPKKRFQIRTRFFLLLIIIVSLFCAGIVLIWRSFVPIYSIQPFESNAWKISRTENSVLNVCPWMLEDLLKNYLELGMTHSEVKDLIGEPKAQIPYGKVLVTQGADEIVTIYVYKPGYRNGWDIQADEPLLLYFRDSPTAKELKGFSPNGCNIQYVDAPESHASQDAKRYNGSLAITHMHVAYTTQQFENILGQPDEIRYEYHLDYCLGQKTHFALDSYYLELHFDHNKKLIKKTYSVH